MIIREQRCTGTVKRKLMKVNYNDNKGNFYMPGPGRFLGLTKIPARGSVRLRSLPRGLVRVRSRDINFA